ncbi:MAG: BatA domain-containing protein, partial [Candidatus Brocadiia bacterium]
MTWQPWGLLGLASLPALLALSLWRWRRREVAVPSLLLWRDVAEEERQSPQARRRRRLDPLLVLRLAVALALTAALCGPVWVAPRRPRRRLVLVVDGSASMAARRPDGRSRWEAARGPLLEALDAMDSADRVAIVLAPAHRPVPTEPVSPAEAARLLRQLGPADAPRGAEALAEAALGAARRYPHGRVLAVTDERPERLPPEASLLASQGSEGNRGIVAFAVRRSSGDGGPRVLVGVLNASRRPASVEVALRAGESEWRRTAPVPPGARRAVVFAPDLGDATALEARLEGRDALAADDRAWLARRPGPLRVALVARQAYYLRRALAVQDRVGVVDCVTPPDGALPPGCDLAVWVHQVPPVLDGGRIVLVAPRRPVGGLGLGEPVTPAGEAVTVADHPLTANVELAGVALGRVPRVAPPQGFHTLARAGDVPLIGLWREGATEALYVGMDPGEGDWALHPSFPVFWTNVVAWAPGQVPGGFAAVEPGTVRQLGPPGQPLTVVGPRDTRRELPRGVFQPWRVGLYRWLAEEGERLIAVSLLSARETEAAGAGIQEGRLVARTPGSDEVAALASPRQLLGPPPSGRGVAASRRLGPPLALLGLLLVAAHAVLASRPGRI